MCDVCLLSWASTFTDAHCADCVVRACLRLLSCAPPLLLPANFDTEMSSQRGPMAISGTYEGSRATAGSSAWWNAAQKDSIGGQAIATNIETYGPTPGKPTLVRKGDDPYGRRSVAFTNNAPNSAAQTGAGNGPAAVSAGEACVHIINKGMQLQRLVCASHSMLGVGLLVNARMCLAALSCAHLPVPWPTLFCSHPSPASVLQHQAMRWRRLQGLPATAKPSRTPLVTARLGRMASLIPPPKTRGAQP